MKTRLTAFGVAMLIQGTIASHSLAQSLVCQKDEPLCCKTELVVDSQSLYRPRLHLVVDRSGSMSTKGGATNAARWEKFNDDLTEAIRPLAESPALADGEIWAFPEVGSEGTCRSPNAPIGRSSSSLLEKLALITKPTPVSKWAGESPLYAAVRSSLAATSSGDIVVVATDGTDTCGGDRAAALKELVQRQVYLLWVALDTPAARNELAALSPLVAAQGAGQWFHGYQATQSLGWTRWLGAMLTSQACTLTVTEPLDLPHLDVGVAEEGWLPGPGPTYRVVSPTAIELLGASCKAYLEGHRIQVVGSRKTCEVWVEPRCPGDADCPRCPGRERVHRLLRSRQGKVERLGEWVTCDGEKGPRGEVGARGPDGTRMLLESHDSPPVDDFLLSAFDTSKPGDRSAFRLQLTAAPLASSPAGPGFSVGLRPLRAFDWLLRSVKEASGRSRSYLDGVADSLEFSAAAAGARPIPGSVNELSSVYALGTGVDLVEFPGFVPGNSTSRISQCLDGKAAATRTRIGIPGARRLLRQCQVVHDALIVMGVNATMDFQQRQEGPLPIQAHYNSIARFGGFLSPQHGLWAVAQLGADSYTKDSYQTVGAGRGRSSYELTARVDWQAFDAFALRAEVSDHVDRGPGTDNNYAEAAVGGDIWLPEGFTIHIGGRTSVYDGRDQFTSFLSLGTARVDQNRLFPALARLGRLGLLEEP